MSSYSFSVKNTSPVLNNFKLHKTGYGNGAKDCVIQSPTKFSTGDYKFDKETNDGKNFDITCFFEAEELSLYFSGFSFAMEASPNSCDYVGYQPFGHFSQVPGNSSGKYTTVTCEGDEPPTPTERDDVIGANGGQVTEFRNLQNTPVPCNQYVSKDRTYGDGFFSLEKEEDLCKFNYENSQCDIGEIKIKELQISVAVEESESGPPVRKATGKITERTIKCGGKISNCVRGPVRVLKEGATNWVEITEIATNEASTKTYTYPKLLGASEDENDGLGWSVKSYANFRRHLAHPEIAFGNSLDVKSSEYDINAFAPLLPNSIQHTFDPNLIERYSRNKTLSNNFSNNDIITQNVAREYGRFLYPNVTALPYAAEPYVGLFGYNVHPFYSFYCFDKAMDVKARIRMMVREWDRKFPASSEDLEYLSDIWKIADSRQDSYDDNEYISSEPILPFPYPIDDIADWDENIPMVRIDSATPDWRPYGTIFSHNGAQLWSGWFNKSYFPGTEKGNP